MGRAQSYGLNIYKIMVMNLSTLLVYVFMFEVGVVRLWTEFNHVVKQF